jgi:hypothetical protein
MVLCIAYVMAGLPLVVYKWGKSPLFCRLITVVSIFTVAFPALAYGEYLLRGYPPHFWGFWWDGEGFIGLVPYALAVGYGWLHLAAASRKVS